MTAEEYLAGVETPPGFGGYPAQDTPQFPTYRDYPSLKETGGLPYKTEIPLLGRAEHRPQVFLGRTVADVPGLVEPGNIDLTNPGLSTRDAFHIEDGGMHVVLPGDLGRDAAILAYQKTGQNLGLFKDEKSADEYTQNLARYQELSGPKPYGLEAAGVTASGQPTRERTGRKDPGYTAQQDQVQKMLANWGVATSPDVIEPQESLRAKDRQVDLITPGNIDLDKLTPVATAGGDADTLAPAIYTDQKKKQTVLFPTIIDGREFPVQDAYRDYTKTGKHLGIFKDTISAVEYRDQLQNRQNQFYGLTGGAIQTQYTGGLPELAPSNLAPEFTAGPKPKGLPTLYNADTGKWEEVSPEEARRMTAPESQRGLLASTAKGIPVPPPSEEESNRLIEAEQAKPTPAPQSVGKGHSADEFLSGAGEPSSKGGYRGPATTFGYQDPQDNGIGFWGTPTNNPHVVGVSLSRKALRENFGPDYEQTAYGKPVQVTNPATGNTIVAPIVDIGPAGWVEARQGSTIDLTHAANQALGGTGKTQMEWKVKLKADDFLSDAAPDQSQVGKGTSADDFLSGTSAPSQVQEKAPPPPTDLPVTPPPSAPPTTSPSGAPWTPLPPPVSAPLKDIVYPQPEVDKMLDADKAKREVGFGESFSRENAREILGMGESLNRFLISPVLQGVSEATKAVAPDSAVAKLADKANRDWQSMMVDAAEKMRKSLEIDPATEVQGLKGEAGGMIGNLFPQLLGAAATPGAMAVKFLLPSVTAGMDAMNRAREHGATPAQQIASFAWGLGESEAFVNLPLHVQSAAAGPLLRFVERTTKAALVAGGAHEALRDINNLITPITGGEQQPFDWKALAKVVVPMGVFGGVLGENARPRAQGPIAEQAFPKGGEAPTPMPGGGVKFAPKPAATPPARAATPRAGIPGTFQPGDKVSIRNPVTGGIQAKGTVVKEIPKFDRVLVELPNGERRLSAKKNIVPETPARAQPTPAAPAPAQVPAGEERFAPPPEKIPEPEPAGAGVGLVASPKAAAAMAEVKEIGKEVKKAAGVPITTQFIRAVKDWKYRKQRGAQVIEDMHREITSAWEGLKLNARAVKVRAEGITNFLQAGGDRATLQKWLDNTKDPKLRAGYEAALNLSPREVAAAARVRQIFQDYLHDLRTMGYDVTEFKNYVTGMWQVKLAEKMGMGIPRTMSDYFRFKRQKFFENYFLGEQEDYNPKTKDIREILAHYVHTADWSMNNRALLQDLLHMTAEDGRPLLGAAGSISVLPRDIEARRQQAQDTLDKWREGKLRKFGERNLDRYGDASMKAGDRAGKIQEASSNVLEEKLDNLKEQRAAALEDSGEKTTREFGDKYDRADTDKEKRQIERDHEKKANERQKAIDDYFDAAEQAAQREHDLTVKHADTLSKSSEDLIQKHAALQGKTFTDLVNDTYAKRQKKIDKMKGMSFLVDPSRIPKNLEGYESLNFPALKNWKRMAYGQNGDPIYSKVDLLVHPDIAKHLERLFGQSTLDKWWGSPSASRLEAYSKGITKLILKDIQQYYKGTLFAGIPSGFHLVHQAGEMGMAFRINPFRGLEKPDLRNNPEHIDMARHGLMLGPDHASMDLFSEGVGGGQKNLVTLGLRKLAEQRGMGYAANVADGIDAVSKWLFGHYIPALGIKAYRAALPRNMERFAPELKAGTLRESDIKDLTADQVNASTGHQNFEASQFWSNKNVQQAMSMLLISPHFTMGRLTKVAQAVPAIFGARKGREQAVGLGITAAMLYLSSRVLNLITDGDPHFEWQRAFQVKMGNRWVGMRSIPGDAQRALPEEWGGQNFGPWLFNRTSPYAHLLTSWWTGYNAHGQKVNFGRALYDMFLGGTPMPLQGLTNRMTQMGSADKLKWWEHLAGAMGFPIQRDSPTSEVKTDATKWMQKYHPASVKTMSLPPSKYINLEFALEENDPGRIKEEIANLKAQGMDLKGIVKGYAERIDHPYTNSQENDKAFSKSNFADQKKLAISRTRKMALIGRLQKYTGISLGEPRDAKYFMDRGQ
jgi:hypothetical protein